MSALGLQNPPFSLRQLQYFVAVAEHLSFGEAAQHCGVSQPGLSAQLATLEEALGVVLFERSPRRVALTWQGERLLPRARAVLSATGEIAREAEQLIDPEQGDLHLGVIPTVAPYLLPALTAALSEALPRVVVYWLEDKTEHLIAQIEDGRLDGAVLALEADIGDVERAPLFWDEFVLATPRGHPLDKRNRFALGDLNGLEPGLLLLDEGHCLRDQVVSFCQPRGIGERRFRATSLSTLAAMVAAGRGVTLLPQMAVATENRAGALRVRRHKAGELGRTIGLVWRKGASRRRLLERVGQVGKRARPA